MAQERKARLFRNGGSQAVRLPADYRFDSDEVYISRDEATGDVILSTRASRNVWKAFVQFRDALHVPREDLDTYMAERPMNQPAEWRSVFEDEQ